MSVRTVRPSASYELQIPTTVEEQHDSSASSFWISNEPLLLQLSSYIRESGDQIPAEERLASRMRKHEGSWKSISGKFCPDVRCDQASAELTDDEGLRWLHAYLVWPHLTIYATISGPEAQVHDDESWARKALNTIALS